MLTQGKRTMTQIFLLCNFSQLTIFFNSTAYQRLVLAGLMLDRVPYLMNCNVYNLNNKTGEMECKIKNTQFIVLTLLHNRNINTTTKEARPIRQILKVTILLPTSSARPGSN